MRDIPCTEGDVVENAVEVLLGADPVNERSGVELVTALRKVSLGEIFEMAP